MKKRNTAIRALSVFLAYAMVCTSVPAAGQEMFGSGVNRETEENTSDLKEFQSSQADEFGTDTGSDAELFGSDDAKQEFQDGENSEEGTDGIRYIKGRPLTEEERKEELEPFKNLKPLDPGIEVESDLTSVYAAYGNREAAFPSSYDARKEGLVTPVKNQNPFGTCWAFGMAAIMETSLLAQNKGTYDLSEEHLSDIFKNDTYSEIHGDLTIENIICTRNADGEDDFYIIDPNTGNVHDSSNLDYGKLLQSIHGGYEFLMATKNVSIERNRINFVFTKSEAYTYLYDMLDKYMREHFAKERVKSIYYHEIIHWLRLMPYKIEKNGKRVLLFYAGMLMVMNDVINNFEEEK